MTEKTVLEELIRSAKAVREHAHEPYSHFKVGAALRSQDGRIFTGCNVENATFGLTVCAERVAIFKAVSEGVTKFTHIVVVAATDTLTPPCGACRQIIWEFCGNIPVTLTNLEGKVEHFQMSDLFPRPFDLNYLKQNKP
ncbi:MAG: cytidine deaminase [Acidobacteria bacterium 37-65-4]|nr:MAG: cytidine deaminase [Acidobacteria bacterium 37-65-4]